MLWVMGSGVHICTCFLLFGVWGVALPMVAVELPVAASWTVMILAIGDHCWEILWINVMSAFDPLV